MYEKTSNAARLLKRVHHAIYHIRAETQKVAAYTPIIIIIICKSHTALVCDVRFFVTVIKKKNNQKCSRSVRISAIEKGNATIRAS